LSDTLIGAWNPPVKDRKWMERDPSSSNPPRTCASPMLATVTINLVAVRKRRMTANSTMAPMRAPATTAAGSATQ
jgi:hypothetical protein